MRVLDGPVCWAWWTSLFILLGNWVATAQITLPSAEYDALYDLYNATSGAGWAWSTEAGAGSHWVFDGNLASPCVRPWQGINCTVISAPGPMYHVALLALPSFNLVGYVPATISDLVNLTHFDLSDNVLTVSIPSTVGSFANLKTLDLSSNELTGTVPESLAQLPRLTELYLQYNELNGEIPVSIGALSNLEVLYLANNYLSGPIPASIVNCTQLSSVHLSNNALTGVIPNDINLMSNLVFLYLPNNQLTGTIPETLGELPNLYRVDIYKNELHGTIPASLCTLPQLHYMYAYLNSFTNTIPACIGNLTQMLELDLDSNILTGSIPYTIGDMVSLELLYLWNNLLTNTIPNSIGGMSNMYDFEINQNMLNGTIPMSIGNITGLGCFDTFTNFLTGTIPSTIVQLSQLVEFNSAYNMHSGSIPAYIGLLSQIQIFYILGNALSGHIPPSLTNLTQMYALEFNYNLFSGSIPNDIGSLLLLEDFSLFHNKLTGTIPASVAQLTSLYAFTVDTNHLHGSLPDGWENFQQMQQMFAFNNELTGTVPDSLGEVPTLMYLHLQDNYLHGPLPSSFADAEMLQYLNASYNHLTGTLDALVTAPSLQEISVAGNYITGTIADAFGLLQSLTDLDISSNKITGALPTALSSLQELRTLAVMSNSLTGPLDGVFTSAQAQLVTVQLDGNEFTGTLPSALFELPSLVALSIVGSCLHGTLPSNICGAEQLEALILYGLTTGESCRGRGVQSLSSGNTFGGSLPACLLSMPEMTTLLLSSNGLTGTIPDGVLVHDHLLELDLSHNSLSGSIPTGVQNHTWYTLDLSHNKFNGVLQGSLFADQNWTFAAFLKSFPNTNVTSGQSAADSWVALNTNRLSGVVPNSLAPLTDLTVLAGNLFQCRYDKSDLPQHDSDIANYECASNTFDVSFYILLGLVACAILVMYYAYDRLRPTVIVIVPDTLKGRLHALFTLLDTFGTLKKVSAYCTAFCVFVLLPVYAILSRYTGTHTHQYAYVVSAVYNSGVAAFVVYFLLWLFLLCAVYCAVHFNQVNTVSSGSADVPNGVLASTVYVWVIFTVVNVTLVLGVNVAFVYIVLYQSSHLQVLAQVLLSLFKLSWNMVCSPYIVRLLQRHFRADEKTTHRYFILQLVVALFNNIAIPCLVVMAVDPNCFNDVLLPPDRQTVTYWQPQCSLGTNGIPCGTISYQRTSLEFTAPFTYSYQCSASFITSYAPAFVYMSISTIFLSPLLQFALLGVYHRTASGTYLHDIVSRCISKLLRPLPEVREKVTNTASPLVGAVSVLVNVLTQLGILLTFGVIFPPVALAMCVSLCATVYYTRYKLRHFMHTVISHEKYEFIEVVNAECDGVGSNEQVQLAVKIVICYCCVFYTMFLFDTLGDTEGFVASVWVLIVVPLAPMLVFMCIYAYYARSAAGIPDRVLQSGSIGGNDTGVELKAVVAPHSSEMKAEHAHAVSAMHQEAL